MLEHGQPNPRGPLNERVVGIEMEQIAIPTSGADAQDVLQRLFIVGTCWQRLDLVLMLDSGSRDRGDGTPSSPF